MYLLHGSLQDESFLEDVNMMLNTGDIPNLYSKEERLEIIEKVSQCVFLHAN
jgi:dynein heavy chain